MRALLANGRLTRRNGLVRCGTVGSIIVYSVRIGPPQPNLLIRKGLLGATNRPFFCLGKVW